MKIGHILKSLRERKGDGQQEVAAYLNSIGFTNVTNKVVSRWERDQRPLDANIFLALCAYYGVDDYSIFYPADIQKNSAHDPFSVLNSKGRQKALEYIGLLSLSNDYSNERITRKRVIPLFDIPVSAGTGSFLDSSNYEDHIVDDSVPTSVDFALRVHGDSMEPAYQDGQIVYVEKRNNLDNGRIGIFSLNDEAYIKKLEGNKLVSLNASYKPIKVNEYDSFYILGEVVL